jgi:hypothetical protein
VILCPSAIAIQGTIRLINQLSRNSEGYVPYIDIAVSQQTLHPRITFEENSGLAAVVSDSIIETVELGKRLIQEQPGKNKGEEAIGNFYRMTLCRCRCALMI